MLTLILHSDDFPGPINPCEWDEEVIFIGRSAESHVRLDDPSVSQKHASIRREGDGYLLVDEGSANGTFVGEKRLEPGVAQALRNEDMFRVGTIWLEVRTDDPELLEPRPASSAGTPSTLPPPPSEPPASPPPASSGADLPPSLSSDAQAIAASGTSKLLALRVTSGVNKGREVAFTHGAGAYLLLGRDSEQCALCLAEGSISRIHARVSWRDGKVWVEDMRSRNGTFFGLSKRLPVGRAVPWPVGEELHVGLDTVVRLVAVAE